VLAYCFFLAFIHRTSVGTVNNEITTEFGMSRTVFGIMASLYFYAYMIMQIPAGLLADNWGPRKTAATGVLIGGAATLLFGYAVNPTMLFIGRFFIGIGMATVFVCLLKIQSQWFPDKMFATLSGFSIFMGNLGGVAGQFPFALTALYFGWQNSYLLVALMTIAGGIACYLLVRNKPEDVGLSPINSQNKSSLNKLGLFEGIKVILSEKRIYGAIIFYLFNQAAFLSFVGAWLVPWLREVHKMNTTTAANFGTLAVVGIMLGSSLSGMISDKLKLRKPVIITGSIICTCMWGLLAFWNTTDYFFIGTVLFTMGISSGVFPLSMAITKEVSPTSITGTAIAILNTIGFLGIASATSLLGYIADLGESLSQAARFGNVLIACFVISMASSFSSLFSYETHARNAGDRS